MRFCRTYGNPIIFWFPTISAANFLKQSRHEIPPEWAGKRFKTRPSEDVNGITVVDSSGNITNEARNVLSAIKKNKCILATGHISWQEANRLVKEALKMRIRKIIITHPIY